MLLNYIRLLRVEHYLKNLFVFAPMFFAFAFSLENFINSTIAFILFSIVASSIYIINDVLDVEEDRKHPKKKFRPIASGSVSKTNAILLSLTLLIISLTISFIFNMKLFYVIFIYFILNVLYSFKLKHIPILDISIIAIGFVLRLYAGSFATNIPLSMWIVLIAFLLSLFIALAKRRDDVLLYLQGNEVRKNIDGYNLELVNTSMTLMSSVTVVSYILYTVSEEVTYRFGTNKLYITSFFVVLGFLRYMQITFVEKNSADPVRVLIKDKFLQITILLWLMSFFVIVKYASKS